MIGKIVSRYRIVSLLGGGGMGVIYKADDTRLGRQVALKFLPPQLTQDRDALERFHREAQAASALNHPNICAIYDIAEHDGETFIVMELLDGQTLEAKLNRQPLALDELLPFALQIADALDAAHSRDIVHRDIKSSNIFVTSRNQIKLLDFGLAKFTTASDPMALAASQMVTVDPQRLTGERQVLGTIVYMSPEQLRGEPLDPRTDVFSFGVVLYEMATGALPFRGDTWIATASAILNDTPADASRANPRIPDRLSDVIRRCLVKELPKRYQSAREVRADLESLSTTSVTAAGPRRAIEAPSSIAVLPFVDMSPEKDQEYFCEGIAEELLNRLSQLHGLRVASRSSSFAVSGKDMDARTMGIRLNVDTLLEGSVRKAGSRLRIAAQLVHAANGYQLWAERYDRQMEDVFAVQDEIAESIAGQLKIALGGGPGDVLRRRYTDNVDAFNLYLKGQYYWNRRFEGQVGKALECFEGAIAIDPSYALAYAGVADCYTQIAGYSLMPPRMAHARATEAARKGIELDDTLAETHTSLAMIQLWFDWDLEGAERSLRKAIGINPRFGLARHYLSLCLAYGAHFAEAVEEVRYAQKLEPVSQIIGATAGLVLYYARRYDEALEECRKILEIEPNAFVPTFVRGAVLAAQGRWKDGIESFELAATMAQNRAFWFALTGYGYAGAGRLADARSVIDELERRIAAQEEYVDPILLAWIHAACRENDSAFAWFERAIADRSCELMLTRVLPVLDPLRDDVRFDALLERIGLVEPSNPKPTIERKETWS